MITKILFLFLLLIVSSLYPTFPFNLPSSLTRFHVRKVTLGERKFLLRRLSTSPSFLEPSTLPQEKMEQLLDDILYSGDIETAFSRNPKVFLHPTFLSFLKQNINSRDDEDERSVLKDAVLLIEKKVLLSDGLGQEADIIFERRLDRIVYTNPNDRKALLEEMKNDLSFGFISFLQSELKSSKDVDVKIVLAEILREISELKGSDFLEASEKRLLNLSSGGSVTAEQILEEKLQEVVKIGDKNEQILAGLLFSKNDLVEDIFNNFDLLDSDFQEFLKQKATRTSDLEEREALSSLLQTIRQVAAKIQEMESERLLRTAEEGELSFDQVKERMKQVQSGGEGEGEAAGDRQQTAVDRDRERVKAREAFQVKATKAETFSSIVSRLEESQTRSSLEEVIRENYSLCDYEFIKMLEEEAARAKEEGKQDLSRRYLDIKRAISQVMVEEMQRAQEKLAAILSKKEPKAMEAEAVRLARRGEVNEALVLLIEGNIQSARRENAERAVQLLSKLLSRIHAEKERKMPEEQRLLRQLLKVQDPQKRKELLFVAFKPSQKLNPSTGEFETNGPPEIPPPVFIDVVRSFIEEFGNVDSFNLMALASSIVDEAQEVATELYGPGMTPQQQQRMMLEKNTVSVWDLANLEEQAMFSGEEIPWENSQFDDKEVEDVLGERARKIGGAESIF